MLFIGRLLSASLEQYDYFPQQSFHAAISQELAVHQMESDLYKKSPCGTGRSRQKVKRLLPLLLGTHQW